MCFLCLWLISTARYNSFCCYWCYHLQSFFFSLPYFAVSNRRWCLVLYSILISHFTSYFLPILCVHCTMYSALGTVTVSCYCYQFLFHSLSIFLQPLFPFHLSFTVSFCQRLFFILLQWFPFSVFLYSSFHQTYKQQNHLTLLSTYLHIFFLTFYIRHIQFRTNFSLSSLFPCRHARFKLFVAAVAVFVVAVLIATILYNYCHDTNNFSALFGIFFLCTLQYSLYSCSIPCTYIVHILVSYFKFKWNFFVDADEKKVANEKNNSTCTKMFTGTVAF